MGFMGYFAGERWSQFEADRSLSNGYYELFTGIKVVTL
jgi:hypothetical protein